MKTIIAGSRTITNASFVNEAISKAGFVITEVVSGCAAGVDTLAERWARLNSIPIASFPANWKGHGKAAGPIRNQVMAEYADALIAVWNGKSRGTKDMIERATKLGLKVYVHMVYVP